ncbi:8164_t:CDS:2, partial [Gigaspora margarita]
MFLENAFVEVADKSLSVHLGDRIREENLTQIGELKGQFLEDLNEFKEDLELYVKPRGAWKASTLGGKEEMKKGDVEKVVYDFLTSKDKLISQDKEQLKDAFAEFLITGENTSLIKTVNRFFVPENQLTLEDIGVLNVAANQFLALNDKKALKLMKMAINEFLELPKESVLKNSIRNFMASPFALENNLSLENEIFIKSKLALEHQITKEDVKILKRCLNDIKDLEKTANNLLALKAKEVLEIAVDKFLTSKRKRVLLILG